MDNGQQIEKEQKLQDKVFTWKKHLSWSLITFGLTLIVTDFVPAAFSTTLLIGSSGYTSFLSLRLSKYKSMWFMLLMFISTVVFAVLFGAFMYGLFLGLSEVL